MSNRVTSNPAGPKRSPSRPSSGGSVSTAIRGGAILACHTIVNASRSTTSASETAAAWWNEVWQERPVEIGCAIAASPFSGA